VALLLGLGPNADDRLEEAVREARFGEGRPGQAVEARERREAYVEGSEEKRAFGGAEGGARFDRQGEHERVEEPLGVLEPDGDGVPTLARDGAGSAAPRHLIAGPGERLKRVKAEAEAEVAPSFGEPAATLREVVHRQCAAVEPGHRPAEADRLDVGKRRRGVQRRVFYKPLLARRGEERELSGQRTLGAETGLDAPACTGVEEGLEGRGSIGLPQPGEKGGGQAASWGGEERVGGHEGGGEPGGGLLDGLVSIHADSRFRSMDEVPAWIRTANECLLEKTPMVARIASS
jgi:hypothetical protein